MPITTRSFQARIHSNWSYLSKPLHRIIRIENDIVEMIHGCVMILTLTGRFLNGELAAFNSSNVAFLMSTPTRQNAMRWHNNNTSQMNSTVSTLGNKLHMPHSLKCEDTTHQPVTEYKVQTIIIAMLNWSILCRYEWRRSRARAYDVSSLNVTSQPQKLTVLTADVFEAILVDPWVMFYTSWQLCYMLHLLTALLYATLANSCVTCYTCRQLCYMLHVLTAVFHATLLDSCVTCYTSQ